MSDDERGSPQVSERNGMTVGERMTDSDTTDSAHIDTVTSITQTDANSSLEISSFVPPFKFSKFATTDEIVNVNADIIDIDSFKYLNKDSLVKALLYLIKNVDQINNDLSSVILPAKADMWCQCEPMGIQSENATSSTHYHSKQVNEIDLILKSFQSSLFKSVDDKLSVVDQKISKALSHLTNCSDSQLNLESSSSSNCEIQESLPPHNITSFENDLLPSIAVTTPTETPVQLVVDIPETPSNIVSEPSKVNVDKKLEKICNVGVASSSSDYVQPFLDQTKPSFAEILADNSSALSSPPSFSAFQPQKPMTCSSKAGPKDSTEVLVLVPNDSSAKTTENMNNVKKVIGNKLKDTQVEFIRANPKSMKVVLGFKNSILRDASEQIITSSSALNSFGYHAKCATKMLPKISLHNVLSEVLDDVDTSSDTTTVRSQEKEVIIDKILSKNPCIKTMKDEGHTLEVVYLNKNPKNNLLTIGLKVSPAIRSAIIQNQQGNIYLGYSRYNFRDRFHFKHCYHCQMIGHISMDCPDKEKHAVCMYCMNNHRSNSCPVKEDASKHCCVRCLASKHGNDAENCKSHNAGDIKCPVTEREITRLKENTEYLSKNLM